MSAVPLKPKRVSKKPDKFDPTPSGEMMATQKKKSRDKEKGKQMKMRKLERQQMRRQKKMNMQKKLKIQMKGPKKN